jgi:hypothetical protein
MYHLGMDAGSCDVLVWLDFLSLDPLDQSGLGWWVDWILGIGNVCLSVCPPFLPWSILIIVSTT